MTYSATIESVDMQILEDISKELNIRLNYRERIITEKLRKFYGINIPHTFIGQDGKCLLKYRKGIYEYYLKSNKNDFIRGLFDGDGSVSYCGTKVGGRIGFSVNSNSPDIKMIIEDYCVLNNLTTNTYFDKRGNGSWYISINQQKDVNKFFNLIYSENPKLYIHRKYNKFLEIGFPIQ